MYINTVCVCHMAGSARPLCTICGIYAMKNAWYVLATLYDCDDAPIGSFDYTNNDSEMHVLCLFP